VPSITNESPLEKEHEMETVLVIDGPEHEPNYILLKDQLENRAHIVYKSDIDSGEKEFSGDMRTGIVVVGACIGSVVPNTQDLVKRIKERPRVKIIAISANKDFREEMICAGCTDACERMELAQVLSKIIEELDKRI